MNDNFDRFFFLNNFYGAVIFNLFVFSSPSESDSADLGIAMRLLFIIIEFCKFSGFCELSDFAFSNGEFGRMVRLTQ